MLYCLPAFKNPMISNHTNVQTVTSLLLRAFSHAHLLPQARCNLDMPEQVCTCISCKIVYASSKRDFSGCSQLFSSMDHIEWTAFTTWGFVDRLSCMMTIHWPVLCNIVRHYLVQLACTCACIRSKSEIGDVHTFSDHRSVQTRMHLPKSACTL